MKCPVCVSEEVVYTGDRWHDTRIMECEECGSSWHVKDKPRMSLWFEWGWLPLLCFAAWGMGAPDWLGYVGFGVMLGMLLGEDHAR